MTLKEELLAKIKANKERNEAILASIPDQYRVYVQYIERNVQVAKNTIELDKTLKDNGMFHYKDGTYLKMSTVYFTVAGRIAMLTDYCNEKDLELIISPSEFIAVNNLWYCQKTVTVLDQGKIVKQSTGLASVGFGGTGVDKTNPLENAETSALGRAIGFLGIGQAEWLATADEVNDAVSRQEQAKQSNEKSNPPEGPLYEVAEVSAMGTGGKIVAVNLETGEQCTFWYTKEDWEKVTVSPGEVITGTAKECRGAKRTFTTLTGIQKVPA